MIDPDDLIAFAGQLVLDADENEAAIRRSISASYYGLFHTLTATGAALFNAGPEMSRRIARAYDRRTLGEACKRLESSQIGPGRLSYDPRLVEVAKAFRQLREARERADYDLSCDLSWDDASELMFLATNARFKLFEVREHPETRDFLLAPFFPDRARRG